MEQKKKATEYSVEIPKQEKYFFLIRNFLNNILSMEDVPDKEKDDIILAVNEACDRFFRMESDTDENIKVDIKIKITAKKITVNLHHKKVAELSLDHKKYDEDRMIMDSVKSKIGDYLIEKSADEVSYSSSKRKGHQVKITKYRGG